MASRIFKGSTVSLEFVGVGAGKPIERSLAQKVAVNPQAILAEASRRVVHGISERVRFGGLGFTGHKLPALQPSTLLAPAILGQSIASQKRQYPVPGRRFMSGPRISPQPLAGTGFMLGAMTHAAVAQNEVRIFFGDTIAAAQARFGNRGTKRHAIQVKRARALRFVGSDGKIHYRRAVAHKGTPPRRFFGFATAERQIVVELVREAMRG